MRKREEQLVIEENKDNFRRYVDGYLRTGWTLAEVQSDFIVPEAYFAARLVREPEPEPTAEAQALAAEREPSQVWRPQPQPGTAPDRFGAPWTEPGSGKTRFSAKAGDRVIWFDGFPDYRFALVARQIEAQLSARDAIVIRGGETISASVPGLRNLSAGGPAPYFQVGDSVAWDRAGVEMDELPFIGRVTELRGTLGYLTGVVRVGPRGDGASYVLPFGRVRNLTRLPWEDPSRLILPGDPVRVNCRPDHPQGVVWAILACEEQNLRARYQVFIPETNALLAGLEWWGVTPLREVGK